MIRPNLFKDSSVDVAIITILDEEYKAVLDQFDNHKHDSGTPESRNLFAWELGELVCGPAKASYSIVLALARGAGTQNGALATYKTIERWNPRYVFLVGIAGGFRSDGLDKGDIVLSDVIYGYEYGKIREQFEPRYDWIYRCDTSLITGTRAFALSTDWADKIREIRPDGIRKAPKSLYGPIASGDKVVDNLDQEIFATVIRAWPKLLAIEMEGAGAAEAIELAKSAGYDVHFLMIRGISDMPQSGVDVTIGSQSGERNEWKKYAAEVAATFTISYIKNGLPDPPTIKSKNGIGVNKPELPTTDPLDVYLSHLVDDLSLWRGLGLRRNVPLEDTYISQFIDSSSPEAETTSDADLLQSLRDCTLQIRRILIEGPAGSGKSNLLRHWALNLANHSCPISSHDYIPIFMPLGLVEQLCEHCGSWNMPFVELVASIYPDASGKTSSALVDSLTEAIDSGAAMILLDAADEVSEEARSEMKSWLERISRSARRCPIVLTSRPGDYVFGMNSFEPMYLRSLNRKQRDLFISKWFQASDLKGQDQAMKELLACSPRLDIPQLAGNPLFLTMMCVEYELTQTLSATPGALLDQFTRILLDRWDEIRTVKRVKNREPFPLDLKLRVLETVASHFFDLGQFRFSDRELIECVEMLLNRLGNPIPANGIIDEIVNTSGLITKDRRGSCQFCHSLFHEYFVALEHANRFRRGEDQKQWISNIYTPRFGNIMQFYKELI